MGKLFPHVLRVGSDLEKMGIIFKVFVCNTGFYQGFTVLAWEGSCRDKPPDIECSQNTLNQKLDIIDVLIKYHKPCILEIKLHH